MVLVDAFNDLGAASAGLSFNGGTLRTGANFVLFGRTGTLNMAGTGTIDTQAFAEQFGGNMSGAGTLTKIGTGSLFLTGSAAGHTGRRQRERGTSWVPTAPMRSGTRVP